MWLTGGKLQAAVCTWLEYLRSGWNERERAILFVRFSYVRVSWRASFGFRSLGSTIFFQFYCTIIVQQIIGDRRAKDRNARSERCSNARLLSAAEHFRRFRSFVIFMVTLRRRTRTGIERRLKRKHRTDLTKDIT